MNNDIPRKAGFTLLFGERRFPCSYRYTFPQPTPPPGSPARDPSHTNVANAVFDADGTYIDTACGSHLSKNIVLSHLRGKGGRAAN